MEHNKLVRDKIPTIIAREGRIPLVRTMDFNEFRDELRKKLKEEVFEYDKNYSLEELVDILEVIYTLATLEGITPDKLENFRRKKVRECGGFSGRVYLCETI